MDKFGMYKRVVQSCAAGPPEAEQRTPQEVGGMIREGGKSAPDDNYVPESKNETAGMGKPMSHSLRMFLESQARHDRLSREIDIRNGLTEEE